MTMSRAVAAAIVRRHAANHYRYQELPVRCLATTTARGTRFPHQQTQAQHQSSYCIINVIQSSCTLLYVQCIHFQNGWRKLRLVKRSARNTYLPVKKQGKSVINIHAYYTPSVKSSINFSEFEAPDDVTHSIINCLPTNLYQILSKHI